MDPYVPSPEEVASIDDALDRQTKAQVEKWKAHLEFVATAKAWLGGQTHEYARFIASELEELELRRKDD